MSGKRCIDIPKVAIPDLPLGLSFTPPATPPVNFNAELCCKLPPVNLKSLPLPIPPVALSTVLTILKEGVKEINDYINQLPLSCPLE